MDNLNLSSFEESDNDIGSESEEEAEDVESPEFPMSFETIKEILSLGITEKTTKIDPDSLKVLQKYSSQVLFDILGRADKIRLSEGQKEITPNHLQNVLAGVILDYF